MALTYNGGTSQEHPRLQFEELYVNAGFRVLCVKRNHCLRAITRSNAGNLLNAGGYGQTQLLGTNTELYSPTNQSSIWMAQMDVGGAGEKEVMMCIRKEQCRNVSGGVWVQEV